MTKTWSGGLRAGSASALLYQAAAVLGEAAGAEECAERFRLAHLSALRSAAAVVAMGATPGRGRHGARLVSVWLLLERVDEGLGDWAHYFAAGARQRAAVEAGSRSAVSVRDADDQLRAARDFLDVVSERVGLLAA